MSLIAKATQRCLSDLNRIPEGAWLATFVFPPDYVGFQGHFPGNPVLPGVCMVEAALAMLAATGLGAVRLMQMVSAKWFAPVRPGETLTFRATFSNDETEGERKVRFRITRQEAKVAELSLIVTTTPDKTEAAS